MPFLGMMGTGDWAAEQRPKNWREGILYLYPNGTALLTALTSKMPSQKTDDPEFNWWTKTLPTQRGTIKAASLQYYADPLAPYDGAGVAGDVIYLEFGGTTPAADSRQFRAGHIVLLRVTGYPLGDVVGKVLGVVSAETPYVRVMLMMADPATGGKDLGDADSLLIIGNMNEEGAKSPEAISYLPVKNYNYTQIWRTSLELTRTALKTRLRTGDSYKEAKREALELHSIGMEKAYLFGTRWEGAGDGDKPERATQGLIRSITTNTGTNFDYTANPTYAGKAWTAADGGKKWFNEMLERIFRYGSTEKLAYVGSGAMLGIQELAETFGTINIAPGAPGYGLKTRLWMTPFGDLHMQTHPLFSYEETNRHMMVIFEPAKLRYRYIDDTAFKINRQDNDVDGRKDEYLTEAGLEFHHEEAFGILYNVGKDA